MSSGGQRVALMHLADRRGDAAMAETARLQIETAWQVTRDGGHEVDAAYYAARIPEARAIAARLREGRLPRIRASRDRTA